jgi:hypothetical protein
MDGFVRLRAGPGSTAAATRIRGPRYISRSDSCPQLPPGRPGRWGRRVLGCPAVAGGSPLARPATSPDRRVHLTARVAHRSSLRDASLRSASRYARGEIRTERSLSRGSGAATRRLRILRAPARLLTCTGRRVATVQISEGGRHNRPRAGIPKGPTARRYRRRKHRSDARSAASVHRRAGGGFGGRTE